MADNKKRNEEMDRKLGGSRDDQGHQQKSPGRNPADDQSAGKNDRIGEDEDADFGGGRMGGRKVDQGAEE